MVELPPSAFRCSTAHFHSNGGALSEAQPSPQLWPDRKEKASVHVRKLVRTRRDARMRDAAGVPTQWPEAASVFIL